MTRLTKVLFTALPAAALATTLAAQSLDVPVMERADEDLDTCAYGKVTGLKADGDGFLAVRSGPGTQFAKIDELVNEDEVWLFEQRGKWIGIAYGTANVNCSPIPADRELQTDGKKGWVHENWIVVLAG